MERRITKTLASCNPHEFVAQTVKIRKAVERWIDATEIMSIRKLIPKTDKNASAEEKRAATEEAVKRNFSMMFDNIMEKHPEETIELLALCSFVDPCDVDKYQMRDFMGVFNDLVNDAEVIGFFTSLLQLGQMTGSIR